MSSLICSLEIIDDFACVQAHGGDLYGPRPCFVTPNPKKGGSLWLNDVVVEPGASPGQRPSVLDRIDGRNLSLTAVNADRLT